jgi:putative transposase
MMLGYKSNNNVVYSCKYHVIWCPKYRRKVLVGAIAKRLEEIMHKTALKYRADLIALEIMPDHVHMLCEVDPQFGIHRFVKNLKGATSHDLRKEFVSLKRRLPSLWTNAYFVSTVSGAPLEVIKQYVENQKNV